MKCHQECSGKSKQEQKREAAGAGRTAGEALLMDPKLIIRRWERMVWWASILIQQMEPMRRQERLVLRERTRGHKDAGDEVCSRNGGTLGVSDKYLAAEFQVLHQLSQYTITISALNKA